MANRFINTGFFKSPFVRSLKGPLKSLYLYIICDCDNSGIWAIDLEVAGTYTGFAQTPKDFEVFISCGKAVDLNNGKYFFPDFIEHQYPKGLSETNPAHANIILDLKKYSLVDGTLKVLPSPFRGTKVMDKEKVMVMDKGMVKEKPELVFPFRSEDFMLTWNVLIKERKWRTKSHSALQAALKKLSLYSESDAITMMNDSIAGEWQGLFETKNHTNGTKTNTGKSKPWGNGIDHLREFTEQQAKHTT